jgi:ComF family protein
VYEGVLKKAILKYKFKRRLALSDPLGALMVKYIERNMYMKMIDLIVPVPLHHSRMKERGFNQAEFLAHVISKYYNVPTVSGMLFRVRETHPQFNLPKRDRFMNVRGAFEIKGSAFAREKNILLVDDIYTTGATTSECTRVLKNSGASSVHVLTLSRALI